MVQFKILQRERLLIQVAFSTGNEIDDNEAHFMIFDASLENQRKMY